MIRRRRQVTDDDCWVEFVEVFDASGSVRTALRAAVALARRKRMPTKLVFPPVVFEVARYYDCSLGQLLHGDRYSPWMDARHVANWLCVDGGLPVLRVARIFGRDNATTRNACQRVEREPDLMAVALEIRQRMQANRARFVGAMARRAA